MIKCSVGEANILIGAKTALFVLCVAVFICPSLSYAITFTDNFSRPDSTTVGDAWVGTGGDVGGYLGVQNNELAAITAISVPPVVSTSREPSLADENRNKAQNVFSAKEAILIGAVEVMGVVGKGDKWKVALKDCTTGDTRTLQEGETAFGYQVTSIAPQGATLEGAGKKYKLRIGEPVSSTSLHLQCEPGSAKTVVLASPIPDLARMGNTEREQWVAQWRRTLSALNLDLEEQEDARAKMRDYWRQQWEEQWEDVFSKMTPEEQESVRREISSYWKW